MTTRARTRDDVVRAASRLFATRGYHGTSMRDLAREVGVLGSSLYSHIDSKADLLVEIVEVGAALFQESGERAVAAGGTGAQQLARLIEGHINVVLDHLDESRTFLNEADALDAEHRARVIAARDRYEEIFRRALAEGAADGSLDPELDPKLAAIFTLSTLNAIERWYRPHGRLSRTELAEALFSFCLRGLGPRSGDL